MSILPDILPKWLTESNRMKHLVGGALVAAVTMVLLRALYGGVFWQHYVIVLFVATAVLMALEFKDVQHSNGAKPLRAWDWGAWDWLDIAAGHIGCVMVEGVVAIICLTLNSIC